MASQPTLQLCSHLLESNLRLSYLCSYYKDITELVWDLGGQEGELVLCSHKISWTKLWMWCGCRRHSEHPCHRWYCKPSFSVQLLGKFHCLLQIWIHCQILGSCRWQILDEGEISYFLNASPFLCRIIQTVLSTGCLEQAGTIIYSQFEGKFFLVASQRSPLVTTTLCDLAASLFVLQICSWPSYVLLLHTGLHTAQCHQSPAGWVTGTHCHHGVVPAPSVLPAHCLAGVLLLQLLIPELTERNTIVFTQILRESLATSV